MSSGKSTPGKNTPSKQDSFLIQGSKQVSREQTMSQDLPPLHMAEAVIGRMMLERQNQPLQEWACERLEELALKPGGQAAIAAHSGIGALLETMRRYPFSCYLQECACGALGNQALRSEECQRSILGQCGLEQIITEDACFALHNMACSDDLMRLIVDQGGLEAIVQAMATHQQMPAIIESACSALHNVGASNGEYSFKLVGLGGLGLIVQAMDAHPANPGLAAQACHVLGLLSLAGPEIREELQRVGAVKVIVATMQALPASPDVQDAGREALRLFTA